MKIETRWFWIGVYSLLAVVLVALASFLSLAGNPGMDRLASYAFALVAPTAITAVVIANGAGKISLLASGASFIAVGFLYVLDTNSRLGWLGYSAAGAIVLISVASEFLFNSRAAAASASAADPEPIPLVDLAAFN